MYYKAVFKSIIGSFILNVMLLLFLIIIGQIEKEGFPTVPIVDYTIKLMSQQNLMVDLVLKLIGGLFYILGIAILLAVYFQKISHLKISKSCKIYIKVGVLLLIYYSSIFIISFYFNFKLNYEQEQGIRNIIFNSIDGICLIASCLLIGSGIVGIVNKEKFSIVQIKKQLNADAVKLYIFLFILSVTLRFLIQNFTEILFPAEPAFSSTMISFMLNCQIYQNKIMALIILKALIIITMFNAVIVNARGKRKGVCK